MSTTAVDPASLAYPNTERGDTVETLFGEQIADPYRWLENDVRSDPKVAEWVAAQNALTERYLDTLPARDWFKQRIGELMDYERFGIPVKRGTRYFYTGNTGLQNQSPLYVQEGLEGSRRLLLDPNGWAKDGATALSDWAASPNGKYLLYSVQDGGTDWRILRVLDVDTGAQTSDEIRWAKFTGLAWVGEEGFLYSRFPEPEQGKDFQALNYNQAVYYHKLGTPQSQDQMVFSTPDHPDYGHSVGISDDGRWAFVISHIGTDARNEVQVIDLASRDKLGWTSRPLISGFKNAWYPIETIGTTAWFMTNADAPRYRIVKVDLAAEDPEWQTVVAERDEPIAGASIVGDQLVVSYLKDAASQAQVYSLDGKPGRKIELNGLGSAGGFGGRPGDPETFYSYSSFNRPSTIYRLDLSTGQSSPFATPKLTFDPDRYTVE